MLVWILYVQTKCTGLVVHMHHVPLYYVRCCVLQHGSVSHPLQQCQSYSDCNVGRNLRYIICSYTTHKRVQRNVGRKLAARKDIHVAHLIFMCVCVTTDEGTSNAIYGEYFAFDFTWLLLQGIGPCMRAANFCQPKKHLRTIINCRHIHHDATVVLLKMCFSLLPQRAFNKDFLFCYSRSKTFKPT